MQIYLNFSINSMMSQQGSNACLTSGSSAPELEDKTDAIIETNDLIMEKVVSTYETCSHKTRTKSP